MKLMIASDIHGSAYYCKKMIEAAVACANEYADKQTKNVEADQMMFRGKIVRLHILIGIQDKARQDRM